MHRIIDRFLQILNWKFILIPVMLDPMGCRPGLTKLVLILWFSFYYSWKIVCNTMLKITFQYGPEPVLIQRILISFQAILEIYIFWIFLFLLKLFVINKDDDVQRISGLWFKQMLAVRGLLNSCIWNKYYLLNFLKK